MRLKFLSVIELCSANLCNSVYHKDHAPKMVYNYLGAPHILFITQGRLFRFPFISLM